MRILGLMFSLLVGFCAVIGVGVIAFGVAMTGGLGRDDLALVRDGVGKAYVSGLKGVEQAARRLRGDYCDDERVGPRDAHCG
jgi:hypothetical protein